MTPRTSARLATGLCAVAVLTIAGSAKAADIATVLGPAVASDPTWAASCPNGNVPDAFSAGVIACDGIFAGLVPWCLHRVDIDTSVPAFHNATCSDGTDASFYVREASDVADANRWVIHLQGGAGCTDEASCQERWCGDDGFYTAAVMSNDWDADGIVDRPEHAWVNGMFSNVAANDFATWNHVFVPYCSSDAYLGRADDVAMGAFTVDARGHAIVRAVRRMLQQRPGDPAWTAAGGYEIGDLDAADEIIFSGSSAGGYGALHNGDWFVSEFPDARSGLVIDAAIDVSPWVAGTWGLWDQASGMSYTLQDLQVEIDRWDTGGYWSEIDAFVDETCRSTYQPDRLEYCMSPSRVLQLAVSGTPLISTPTFVRMDLEDPVLSTWIVGPNPNGADVRIGSGGPTPTLQDYTEMMRATMVDLDADPQTDITVQAPRCAKHVGVENDNRFAVWTTDDTLDVATRDPQSIDATFQEALLEWFNPGGSFAGERRIDTDEVGVKYSSCP